jgi:hypothetical protein
LDFEKKVSALPAIVPESPLSLLDCNIIATIRKTATTIIAIPKTTVPGSLSACTVVSSVPEEVVKAKIRESI